VAREALFSASCRVTAFVVFSPLMLKSDYIPCGCCAFTAFLMTTDGLDCFVADSRTFFTSAADGELFKLFMLGLSTSEGG